jgi:hypothetical protein
MKPPDPFSMNSLAMEHSSGNEKPETNQQYPCCLFPATVDILKSRFIRLVACPTCQWIPVPAVAAGIIVVSITKFRSERKKFCSGCQGPRVRRLGLYAYILVLPPIDAVAVRAYLSRHIWICVCKTRVNPRDTEMNSKPIMASPVNAGSAMSWGLLLKSPTLNTFLSVIIVDRLAMRSQGSGVKAAAQ